MTSPRPRATTRANEHLAVVLWVAAGILWLASAFVPTTSTGLGSTLAAHQLADLVHSGSVSYWVPAWIGLAWYLAPAGGAVLILASSIEHQAAKWLRVTAAVTSAVVSFGLAVAITRWSPSKFGPATWLSIIAALTAVTAQVLSTATAGGSSRTASD